MRKKRYESFDKGAGKILKRVNWPWQNWEILLKSLENLRQKAVNRSSTNNWSICIWPDDLYSVVLCGSSVFLSVTKENLHNLSRESGRVTQRSTEWHRDKYRLYCRSITSKTGGEAIVFLTLHNSALRLLLLYFSGKSEGSLISSLMLTGNPDSSSNSVLWLFDVICRDISIVTKWFYIDPRTGSNRSEE